jgi:hypothetical protein
MIVIPTFETKEERVDWYIANKGALIAQKKSSIKHADAITYLVPLMSEKGDSVIKSEAIPDTATRIKVRAIINTTKLFDSHGDVHIDQLWNKSLKESKDNYLVNQHNFSFEGIISDNVKAFVKQMTWAELGYGGWEGTTQALVYDVVIDKADSPDMFERYRKGKVKNHSVGMRYVKVEMAVDDDRYEKEKTVWDKYYPVIANKADVDAAGVFWAVTEAKNIEGSAVVKGSNFVTPTFSVQETKGQPSEDTGNDEPVPTTHDKGLLEALNKLSKTLTLP